VLQRDDEPTLKTARPCALCEAGPGIWLVFGSRHLCDGCVLAWRTSDRWPEDRVRGSFAPVFEQWFSDRKAELRRGAA
jgi:hypothetical protein